MKKDTFYFSHDYNARQDDKIKKLIRKHGMAGYGIFWSIVEDLYNNANALHLDYDGIAFDMRSEEGIIKSIIEDFDLFVIDGDSFGSMSIERRLTEREAKSGKARESAKKRWELHKNKNANAMRTHTDGNAIKEKKGKEIKENLVSDSKEPDLNSNKVVKKKKEKEPHKSYNHIKEKFLKHYSEAGPGTPYYFEAKDGNKINRIIAKLKTLVKAKNPNITEDNEPDAINRSFDYILANMNDKFVNENLSLSMIDSKFNEIVAKVKKGKVEEKEVKSIKFRI